MDYDILVIGSGIGGMESALKLGEMGYKVLVVEKEPSVGGKMILLSKVFPTLDCASCISTPKMAATVNHPNVKVMVYAEVEQITKVAGGNFTASIRKKPTFVNSGLCTGCRECENTCNVAVPDQYNADMVGRRAVHIVYPQAVPKKAVIERQGTSPCSYTCPAGIKAHGYVALIRSGKYEEAFRLVQDNTPLVGSLGRACYAPCEGECTRKSIEGAVSIRRLKRFLADRFYQRHAEPDNRVTAELKDLRVAIIGSGPAGLTAAYHLARKGYGVKIFEAESEPGGMLRYAIPAYRLPKDVVARDIKNVTALGVEIETGVRVQSINSLKEQGFAAIFIATGTPGTKKMKIAGEELDGVISSLDFLKAVNSGKQVSLQDKTVIVTGGGDVAIDCARVALRLGAKKVMLQYRRSRAEMPAQAWEVEAAEREGVEFQYLRTPSRFIGRDGKLTAVESMAMKLSAPDADGRRTPSPIAGSEQEILAQLVITATGLLPETNYLAGEQALNEDGTILVEPETLQTSVPEVFAGGDVVTGPQSIAVAVGQGRRAAFFLDLFLSGANLRQHEFNYQLPVIAREQVLQRQHHYTRHSPADRHAINGREVCDFAEIEPPLTAEEAQASAGRCLDCGVCSECQQCIEVCPAKAIDLQMQEEKVEVEIGSVIVATGFKLFPADLKPQYGYGKYKNVLTGMQMDRLLAPTRPYNAVLRPADGKVPENIAYILCTGSRDGTVDNPLCSRVCCMYSIKQNQLIMGALPLADVTIYYMDIRAFSKGYDEFYEQAKAMGARFVRGRVAKIEELPGGNLELCYEDIEQGGKVSRAEHDLVVLGVGILPNLQAFELFAQEHLEPDEFFYVKEVEEDLNPGKTSIEGVFVAGSAAGAKDIPDAILHAGAAAAQAAAYVERIRMKK